MSKLDEFLSKLDPTAAAPEGVEWNASVNCQTCRERVPTQTLYPNEHVLVWHCSQGHRSHIENFPVF